MKYIPHPADTSGVKLDESITGLAELLAKNTHELWAQERLAQGWRYGEKRDDEKKEHPCLIPYDMLPESEKVYDRNTSTEALKLICALGYEIKKKDTP